MEPCLLQFTQYLGAGSALVGVFAAAGPARTTLAVLVHDAWSQIKDMG
jgi:hypothetical protein